MTEFPTIEKLLPHNAPMILIDKMIDVDELTVQCEVTITEQSLFFDEDDQGVAGWVGLEYMAQTIGAWSGFHNLQKGCASPIGFLLGSRRYQSDSPLFVKGMTLHIFGEQLLEDNGMAVFRCEIKENNKLLATSQLNVFVPTPEKLNELLGDNHE
jgi:predicted hotdog family 3-hydroxylacyl-ACP dehydratase